MRRRPWIWNRSCASAKGCAWPPSTRACACSNGIAPPPGSPPDVLEQRIGRLDRIGQKETIRLHVPWLQDSAQAVLFPWYHEGLNAFLRTCPAGPGVYAQVHPSADAIRDLLAQTRPVFERIDRRLKEGRDRLLELNAYRPEIARPLVAAIREQDADPFLYDYLTRLADAFGVEVEEHSRANLNAGASLSRAGR